MANVNQIKFTIGGPETLVGSGIAREFVIPIRGVSDLDKKPEGIEDPAILGRDMSSGEYIVANDVSGSIPLTPRPCGGMGQLIKSLLAQETTPVQVGALIRLKYTGASASCKIGADNSANTLTSEIGTKGSESGDASFGVAGVIDCDDAAYDTVDELVAAIQGYTYYTCEKVFEQSADYDIATNKIVAITNKQGKNMWCYVWFLSSDSGVYLHEIYYDPTDTDQHGTYSIQKDGYQDNFLYDGCVVNALRISAALKSLVEGDVDILGMEETAGQSISALAMEDVDPLLFYNGSFSIGANTYTYIKNMSLDVNQNHSPEGYGQGSTNRAYHQKGKCEITGDATLRLDATSLTERDAMLNNVSAGVSYYFKGKLFAGTSIPEMMLVELPYCYVNQFEFTENAGVFDARVAYRATYPKGTVYNNPITISILTVDSSVY